MAYNIDPIWNFMAANFKGGVAFDVGANHGHYTKSLAKRAERVFAFEPVPDIAVDLRSLKIKNAVIIEAAVSDTNGKAVLYVDRRPGLDGVASSFVELTGMEDLTSPVEVTTLTIDTFCETQAVSPSLIKIDVEGHEYAAFQGSRQTIEHYKPILIFEFWETWWKLGRFDEIFDWLSRIYKMSVIQSGEDAVAKYTPDSRPSRNEVTVDIGCVPLLR